MTPTNTNDELTRLRQRVEELERSEARYRGIFESSPISLWAEDWSAVRQHLARIFASGVSDLGAYFQTHASELLVCIGLVKILDVNRATLELCGAASKEQIFAGLSVIFNATRSS